MTFAFQQVSADSAYWPALVLWPFSALSQTDAKPTHDAVLISACRVNAATTKVTNIEAYLHTSHSESSIGRFVQS